MFLTISIALFPFALIDFKALFYNVVTKYPIVVKTAVWSREWIFHTFGTTAFLVKKGCGDLVFPAQLFVMSGVYAGAFFFIRRKQQALLWMPAALMMYSMTAIWPVTYIFLDVLILLVFALILQSDATVALKPKAGLQTFTWSLVFSIILVACLLSMHLKDETNLDIGHPDYRQNLYRGFYDSEDWAGRTICWSQGNKSMVQLNRRSSLPAMVEITCLPFDGNTDSYQTIILILNGYPIGSAELAWGWNTIKFKVPKKRFNIGNNFLEIRYSHILSPEDVGLSKDNRKLAVAFDKINIVNVNEQ
jgi:hypothetical protein